MPRKCEWNQRLNEIIPVIEQVPAGLLDRAHIEQIFSAGPRQATRILHRLGATKLGGALIVDREAALERLRQMEQDPELAFERERRERFAVEIARARRETRSRRIEIPLPPAIAQRLTDLPAEVELEPGQLRIRFGTPVELLQHLLQLTQALAEDWESLPESTASAGK